MDSSGLEAAPTSVWYFASSSVRLSVKRYIQIRVSMPSPLLVSKSVCSPLAPSPITQGQLDQAPLSTQPS